MIFKSQSPQELLFQASSCTVAPSMLLIVKSHMRFTMQFIILMFKDEGDVQTINGRAWFVYVPGNSCCQISHKHQIGRNDFLLIFADLVTRCKEGFIQKHEKCLHKNLLI